MPLIGRPPETGQIVRVRQRQYLVEDVVQANGRGDHSGGHGKGRGHTAGDTDRVAREATLVRLSCVDDDAQGQPLEILWEHEVDPEILTAESWASLATRFGLIFAVMDKGTIARARQERGFGINPWTTHTRFLISQRLLIDESYVGPLRDWLGELRPGSLLILDEAHHAAPASGTRYAIDSKITRAVRDLAPRFEHPSRLVSPAGGT